MVASSLTLVAIIEFPPQELLRQAVDDLLERQILDGVVINNRKYVTQITGRRGLMERQLHTGEGANVSRYASMALSVAKP
jgi:hypothetical protein